MTIVDDKLIGDVWPQAQPGADPVLYGSVTLAPEGAFEARSLQTFTLTYRAGRFGLDDTGSIKIVHRYSNDWGRLQTEDPGDFNYVTAQASNGSRLQLVYENGGEQRPWYRSLTIHVKGDGLYEGDSISVVFGDRSGGSPGLKLQTFCESGFVFKLLADVCATGHYIPVPDMPAIAIVPGAATAWKAVLPGLRQPGESFRLGIKAEDLWGNPTGLARADLHLQSNLAVEGLPATISYGPDERARVIDNLRVREPGILRIGLLNEQGDKLTESNPLVIRAGEYSGYWGDMHGQSGESVGINTAREYFEFARNLAFLDATGHQANDFQINNAFWQQVNDLSAEFHEDHRFLTLPGYEWSGNTAVGGDRNVYFRDEDRQIRRSSHALLPDRSDLHTDANTAAQLFSPGARPAPRNRDGNSLRLGQFRMAVDRWFRTRSSQRGGLQQRRPQGTARRELPRRRELWRLRRPDLFPDAGANPRQPVRMPAPPSSLRHHRQSPAPRGTRQLYDRGQSLRARPEVFRDRGRTGATGDHG